MEGAVPVLLVEISMRWFAPNIQIRSWTRTLTSKTGFESSQFNNSIVQSVELVVDGNKYLPEFQFNPQPFPRTKNEGSLPIVDGYITFNSTLC